jgi:hypothetical protein
MTEKTEKKWYRVVGLRVRWAGSGQVKDGLLFFSPFFFLSSPLLLFAAFFLGENKRGFENI